MYKKQCVLALAALYLALAHSWDIAVSVEDQLIFFTDGTKTNTVNFISHNLTALAYDEVHNMMLYVDKQSEYDAICGYNLHSKENQCFIKRVGGNIHSIVFDPATDTLFFTDTVTRSINWISLKLGSTNNVYGNLLIKMDDRTPSDIAVDSCRRYIYWTNTHIITDEYIERARFNGSERKVIYNLYPVLSMAMDPLTRKMYDFDRDRLNNYLDRRNWDGGYESTILYFDHSLGEQKVLTVSNDYLYWTDSREIYKTVWQLPKNAAKGVQPKEISKFYTESPLGIAANYRIKDQIQGFQDCEVLSDLIPKLTETYNCLNIQQTTETEQTTEYTTVAELFCVHGTKLSETSVCKCTPGYIGERCDVSVCENHCLQGDCSFNDEGLPKCRCNAGYSGERCEVYACHGYCLNNGNCSLNEEDEPFCQCVDKYEGTRCEAAINDTFSNTPFDLVKRNLTLADLLSNWRKPTSKMYLTVEV